MKRLPQDPLASRTWQRKWEHLHMMSCAPFPYSGRFRMLLKGERSFDAAEPPDDGQHAHGLAVTMTAATTKQKPQERQP